MQMRTYFLPNFEKDDYMSETLTKADFEIFETEIGERRNCASSAGNDNNDKVDGDDEGDRDDDSGIIDQDDDDYDANLMDRETVETLKGYSKAEVMYMKDNLMLEIPHNFPKKMTVMTKREKETKATIKRLFFGAFELRTKFPHNIALLKDGTIMYCTDFKVDKEQPSTSGEEDENAGNSDAADDIIYVTGHRFLRVRQQTKKFIILNIITCNWKTLHLILQHNNNISCVLDDLFAQYNLMHYHNMVIMFYFYIQATDLFNDCEYGFVPMHGTRPSSGQRRLGM